MKSILHILRAARPQLPWLLSGIMLGIFVIGANTALMAVSGWFIASMAAAGVAGASFNYFLPATAIRLFAILRTVGRYVERLITHDASFRYLAAVRVWLFGSLAPLAPAGLERLTGGEVAGRLRGDVDALESLYLRIIAPLATGFAASSLSVMLVSRVSGTMALALGASLAAAGIFLPLAGGRLTKEPGKDAAAAASELRTAVTEGLQGKEELALFGGAETHCRRVEEISRRLATKQEHVASVGSLTFAGSAVCATAISSFFLLIGIPLVEGGIIPGPSLVMLLLFGAAVFEAAGPMASSLAHLPAAGEAAERISALTCAALPVPEPPKPMPLPDRHDLAFRSVCFSHEAGGPAAIRGIDLEIPEGSVTAITGASGAGKSTLLEILLRFRDYEGLLTLGGIDIRRFSSDDLRARISALPQKPHLFNTTILENILLGNPDASALQVRSVLDDTALGEWVDGLPEGLETRVGEGGKAVSGGEARRIALARALLKDVPLLLLDEPTEGLDAATERIVVEGLRRRVKGRTVVLTSHRPLPLSLADIVVEIENGRVARTRQGSGEV